MPAAKNRFQILNLHPKKHIFRRRKKHPKKNMVLKEKFTVEMNVKVILLDHKKIIWLF